MRLAEMEGRTADLDRLKNESDSAKASFREINDIVKAFQSELDRRAITTH
jgi:hypothetical protein